MLSLRSLIVAAHDARLKDLAYKDVVWVSPDLDQEEVAEEMAKYNLAAMPVCDEARHILGIVTVDDAMDVMTEEHAEDLQIAGVTAGENTTGESAHAITWFAQRQYWFVVWAGGRRGARRPARGRHRTGCPIWWRSRSWPCRWRCCPPPAWCPS